MKGIKFFIAAGAVAFAPAVASAFHGNILSCTPTAGQEVIVSLSPGLQCDAVKNKISIKGAISDNCTIGAGTLAAPSSLAFCAAAGDPVACCTGAGTGPTCTLWDEWQASKVGFKIEGAGAAAIDKVSVSLKATVFGTCNFSGSPDAIQAGSAGKFALLNSIDEKVGGGAFFGNVGGDLATQSAATSALITKGFGVGSAFRVLIGINLAGTSACDPAETPGTCNGAVLACNLGAACPPNIDPAFLLDLITTPTSQLRIDVENNAECLANGDPFPCCTGVAAGNC